jgi:hypothetical protein
LDKLPQLPWKQKRGDLIFVISIATAAKLVLLIPILLAYLVPLDVVVTGNITAKICESLSEFKKNCTLVTMADLIFV